MVTATSQDIIGNTFTTEEWAIFKLIAPDNAAKLEQNVRRLEVLEGQIEELDKQIEGRA